MSEPAIKNVFTDYNGTFDSAYLEIPLAYVLADRYRSEGDWKKYLGLMALKQPKLIAKMMKGDMFKLIQSYVDDVLNGETMEAFNDMSEIVCSSSFDDALPGYVKWACENSGRVMRKVYSHIDDDAVRVFEQAKKNGMTTGIYTTSLVPLIDAKLRHKGIRGLFDHIIGNDLFALCDGTIFALDVNVDECKSGFERALREEAKLEICETAYIDDRKPYPLRDAGLGIVAPGAKEKFRIEMRREEDVFVPENWRQVGERLSLW